MVCMIKKINNNSLFIGDNLLALNKMDDNCVDLIYLDPPFNSNKKYKQLKENNSKIVEFEDIWDECDKDWFYIIQNKNSSLYSFLNIIDRMGNTTRARRNKCYLAFMSIRLLEMKRVLKDTGCIYLHCDTNGSHYLKIIMDCIFGAHNFINEIVWGYKWGGVGKKSFARKHDTIFLYSKTDTYTFNRDSVLEQYTTKDSKWHNNPNGKLIRDVWDDIPIINTQSKERTGYPTQKPVTLLERVIKASSNKGDTVLDPFCGSGTTLVVSERLERKWIGIDKNRNVENIIKDRLNTNSFAVSKI